MKSNHEKFVRCCLIAIAFNITPAIAFAPPASASGYTFKKLRTFCSQASCADGGRPLGGLLMDPNGTLFGTGIVGGKYFNGVAFALTPSGGKYKYSVIHDFCNSSCKDGASPSGDLIADVDGNLYGATSEFGANNEGAVFMLSRKGTHWTLKVLYSFCAKSNCTDGGEPATGLSYKGQASGAAWDKTSPLFGTVSLGGAHNHGAIFELVHNGSQWDYAVIHDLILGFDPNPVLVDSNGNLIVTDQDGGKFGEGVLFRLARDTWNETTLHNFCAEQNCTDGALPLGRMVEDAKGNLFGVTGGGGAADHGTFFEYPGGGGYTVIYNFCAFAGCADGDGPGSLIQGSSGKFFGTAGGGANDLGAVFTLSHKNGVWSESVIHNFCGSAKCTDGAAPISLLQDVSGNFFGATQSGGNESNCGFGGGCGIVLELKP